MKVSSQQLTVRQLLNGLRRWRTCAKPRTLAFGTDATPLRVAVTGKSRGGHQCEIEAVEPKVYGSDDTEANVFDYRQRRLARTNAFNAVMLIPTGVDCAIGGHAGDATPAARLLGLACATSSCCTRTWSTPRTSTSRPRTACTWKAASSAGC